MIGDWLMFAGVILCAGAMFLLLWLLLDTAVDP